MTSTHKACICLNAEHITSDSNYCAYNYSWTKLYTHTHTQALIWTVINVVIGVLLIVSSQTAGSKNSSVVKQQTCNMWSKSLESESQQKQQENFLLQHQLSVADFYFSIHSIHTHAFMHTHTHMRAHTHTHTHTQIHTHTHTKKTPHTHVMYLKQQWAADAACWHRCGQDRCPQVAVSGVGARSLPPPGPGSASPSAELWASDPHSGPGTSVGTALSVEFINSTICLVYQQG